MGGVGAIARGNPEAFDAEEAFFGDRGYVENGRLSHPEREIGGEK